MKLKLVTIFAKGYSYSCTEYFDVPVGNIISDTMINSLIPCDGSIDISIEDGETENG